MSLISPLFAPRRRARLSFRSRRLQRINLICESLESRQLLSVNTASTSLSQITVQPNLQASPLVLTGPTGLTPQQIQVAYGVNQITFSGGKVTGNGAGQTIAIVDAYNDPNISSDLAAFDSQYGLPAPPSFTVKNLGATQTDPGWALETALDVEWAHALAPAANLVLVEAASATLSGLLSAVSYASALPGVSVVSMSWGSNEFYGEWNYNSVFTTPKGHTNVTFVAASGDAGAWSGPSFPSVLPNVLAVGGTTLTLGAGNTYGSESGWTGSTGGFSGMDNGYRYGVAEPSYQTASLTAAGMNYGIRTTPDVSFNGDPNSGVAVYSSVSDNGQSGWFQVGGTSAAAPAWAGLVAIADQGLATGGKGPLSTTQLLTNLYSLPSTDFNDITTGFNGYFATKGYDLVTGLGTPKANLLVTGLLSANGVSTGSTAAQASVTVTATASSSSSHHLVLVSSSSNGSGSGSSTNSGSSLSAGATPGSTVSSSTTAQALTALPAPTSGTQIAAANSSQVQQSSPGTSSTPAPSTVSSTSLGQGLLQQSTSQRWETDREPEPLPTLDSIESGESIVMPPSETPTPDPSPAPRQAPAQPPAVPAVPLLDPLLDDLDQPLARTAESLLTGRALPIAVDTDEVLSTGGQCGPSTLIGAAAVAAGGYRLVLGRSESKRRSMPMFRFPMW